MKKYIEPAIIGKAYLTDGGFYRCFDGKRWRYCDKRGNIKTEDTDNG